MSSDVSLDTKYKLMLQVFIMTASLNLPNSFLKILKQIEQSKKCILTDFKNATLG